MFEFGGELFESEIDLLDALRKAYLEGDEQLVEDALEKYGFDKSDLGVE